MTELYAPFFPKLAWPMLVAPGSPESLATAGASASGYAGMGGLPMAVSGLHGREAAAGPEGGKVVLCCCCAVCRGCSPCGVC